MPVSCKMRVSDNLKVYYVIPTDSLAWSSEEDIWK